MGNTDSAHQQTASQSKEYHYGRLYFIDGMRGIASLSVVLYHLTLNLHQELAQILPHWLMTFMSNGDQGVIVFFIISGLVISLSIGNARITRSYTGSFILRRSVRLDPAYWCSICLALSLLVIKNNYLVEQSPLPSGSTILAHLFYLQELLQTDPVISVVYWTLCLEIQLYLFYVFSLWLSQKLNYTKANHEYFILLSFTIPLGILSLLYNFLLIPPSIEGLFVPYWHYFLLGILIANVIRGLSYSSSILFVWFVIELMFLIINNFQINVAIGLVFTAIVMVLWFYKKLDKTLIHPIFQYFGVLSYSLYLLHPDIGWKLISLGKHYLGDNMTPAYALLLFIAGIISSVIAAHIFNRIIEKPSLKIAKRLKKETLREILFGNLRNKIRR